MSCFLETYYSNLELYVSHGVVFNENKTLLVGGPVGPLPPFFFLLKILLLRTYKNSGGVMVRWHFPNLALPIFVFAPPLNAIPIITNSLILAGRYSPPCVMDRQIIAMLEHHEFPG
jgi:hypothetical protein